MAKRPSKAVLAKMYESGMTQQAIADQLGTSRSRVSVWMKDYGIKSRWGGNSKYDDMPLEEQPLYRHKDWLIEQYIEKKRNTYDIADECGVSAVTVQKALKRFGIPVRHYKDQHPPYLDEAWLRHQYIDLGKTFEQIGKECGVALQTIWKWGKKYGIKSRDWNEEKANHVKLTSEALEFIQGELLGDMSIAMNGTASARIEHSSQHEGYLKWLSAQLNIFGIEQQRISKYATNWGSHFLYSSKSYRELVDLRQKWYPNGKKIIPGDLKLTPLIARQWMIGDGCLHNPGEQSKNKSKWIKFATDSFTRQEIQFLANQLQELGFLVSLPPSRPIIRIGARSVRDFLDYIGPCPPEIQPFYGYKFQLDLSKEEWIERIQPKLPALSYYNLIERR